MPDTGKTRRTRAGFLPKVPLVALGFTTLAYPFAVYFGFGRIAPAWLASGLVLLALLRAWAARDVVWLLAGAGAAVLALVSLAGDSWLPVKLYPVLVNTCLLMVFAASLVRPPTVIERIARLGDPLLPAAALPYIRKVTMAWCGFFVVNGSLALVTTIWTSQRTWLLYNGFLAYVLMGAFFGGEWLLRRRVRARATGRPIHV